MSENRRWWQGFAVQGIVWRRSIDWIILHLPAWFQAPLISIATCLFFCIAGPARRATVRHLRVILPGSSALGNYLRTLRIFANFGWSLADAAAHRLLKAPFHYELDGATFLQQLADSRGAIVLTAHMGNYDLGAALFAEKFNRQIRMVRAPEPDALAAQHVDLSLQHASAGAVKVDYSGDGNLLAFDLLSALRAGEIISIQGDRVAAGVARSPVTLFGRKVLLPTGPFILSLVSERPICPLFIVRAGYRKYRIIAREPISCVRSGASRDAQIAEAMQRWAQVLEQTVQENWRQWFAFTPVFD